MNKKFKASLIALAMVGVVGSFAACGGTNSDNPNKPDDPNPPVTTPTDRKPVTPNATAHYAEDTRANAYGFYLADGTLQSSYNDMYKAIEACVEDGDEGDYVAKLSGDDKDVKLFTFKDVYSGTSYDQFYYYENGTSLDRYTPWESSYHTDLASKSKNDLVVYKTAQGLDTYRQGYEVVRPGVTGGTVATWNIYPFYDSSVMIDLPAYCGITKAEYTINLKEAKLYPTYEGYQTTYAKVGFLIPDANNVAHIGLAADVNTGNWYYFYGNAGTELSYDTWNGVDGIDYVTDECWMTSTWNEEGGYYTPDSNIVITAEIIAMTEEGDEEPYYINRLTVKFDDDTTLVKDYEHSEMTACATLRFMSGLDIQNEEGMPMYDNGAQFQGLKVTSGKGTIREDVANDPSLYGDKTVPNDPGVYDLLDNSKNPEDSDVCLHTVLYNRATITYDYSTPGTDIYNFSFRFEQNQPAYSSNIRAVKDGIAGLPSVDELTVEDDEALQTVVDAYNYLVNPYQTDYITDAEKETLDALQKKMATLKLSGGASAVIEAVNSLKEIGFDAEQNYTTAADLKLQATTIKAAYDAYVALSEEEKAGLEVLGIDAKLIALHKALTAIEANENLGKLLDNTILAYNTEGITENEDGTVTRVWTVSDALNLGATPYNFYKAYTACTAAEIANLPANILEVINSTYAQNLLREEYLYVRTLQVVSGWYTKIGWELPHFGWTNELGVYSDDMDKDASNGWFFKTDGDYVLTDELFALIPEAEIAELAALWSEAYTPLNDTYALRLNSFVIDKLLVGEGFATDQNYQIMALFYAVLDYKTDDAYAFDRKPANPEEGVSYTRRVISPMGAVITAAKGLEGVYVDENTVAGICDFDGATYVLPLKALWDNLNAAQRAALAKIPGTEHVEWAINNYYGEYDKMNSVKEKALALDATAADFETKLAEVVEIFNTLYNSSSYFFRDSNSQWAPNDGTFVKGSYEEAWTKLSTVMEGHYQLDGYYLVPVTADAE